MCERIRFQLLVGAAPADYLAAHAGALRAGKATPGVARKLCAHRALAASYARIHLLDNDSIEDSRR